MWMEINQLPEILWGSSFTHQLAENGSTDPKRSAWVRSRRRTPWIRMKKLDAKEFGLKNLPTPACALREIRIGLSFGVWRRESLACTSVQFLRSRMTCGKPTGWHALITWHLTDRILTHWFIREHAWRWHALTRMWLSVTFEIGFWLWFRTYSTVGHVNT